MVLCAQFVPIRPRSDHWQAGYPSVSQYQPSVRQITLLSDKHCLVRACSLFQYGPGAIIGELDFFLQRPRSFVAHADGAVQLLVLPRAQFERMAREAPALTTLLQVRNPHYPV